MSALSGCIVVEGQQRALLLCVAEERQSKLYQLLRAGVLLRRRAAAAHVAGRVVAGQHDRLLLHLLT
jgi:hypothetical protein